MISRLLARISLTVLTSLSIVGLAAQAQRPQLGRISFPTSETGPAQAAFERGVLYLHNFEYDEAILAFRDARRQSPGFAMAYWEGFRTQPHWHEQLARARDVLNQLRPSVALAKARRPARTPISPPSSGCSAQAIASSASVHLPMVLPSSAATFRTTKKRACFRRWRC